MPDTSITFENTEWGSLALEIVRARFTRAGLTVHVHEHPDRRVLEVLAVSRLIEPRR